jgi:glutaredoxin
MFSLIRKWLRRRPIPRPDLHLIMYTRRDCHLCDNAWSLLCAHQKRRGFALEKIDVDCDAQLVKEYGDCVPVVLVNGQVRFRGLVNEVLLTRTLDAR